MNDKDYTIVNIEDYIHTLNPDCFHVIDSNGKMTKLIYLLRDTSSMLSWAQRAYIPSSKLNKIDKIKNTYLGKIFYG